MEQSITPEQQEILDSFHKALPAILEGRDPEPMVWASNGKLHPWDRPPILPTGPSKKMILHIVCEVAGISRATILGNLRHRRFVRPRHVACYLIHEYRPRMSLPQIGEFMGDRDHTTIINAIRRIQDLLEHDDSTQQLYHEVKRRLAAA